MAELDINELTKKIIDCAYEVSNTLGTGFVEKVYENAYVHEMRKDSSISVLQQYPITVKYDGVAVGDFFADLLVNKRVLIELKVVSKLNDIHMAQALNYLRATGFETCLLINFGKTRIEVRRLYPSPRWKTTGDKRR